MLRLPAINRRWIQWSLRGFLVAIAVLAAGFAWYGSRLRREARINHAARLIAARAKLARRPRGGPNRDCPRRKFAVRPASCGCD